MEEWKEIAGYDGLYSVSNYGNVKKRGYTGRRKRYYPERLVSQRKDTDGYCIVTLYNKDGQRKDWKVHRLVAIAFIPNPNNYPQVNHKNEIKDCNYVGNLEWCTAQYNANYGSRPYKLSVWQKGKPNPSAQGSRNYFYGKHFTGKDSYTAKRVSQYTRTGEYIRSFDCMREAAESVGVTGGAISMCCRKVRETAAGYIWKYA